MRRIYALLIGCLVMVGCSGVSLALSSDIPLPVEVYQSDNLREIRKIYELPPGTDPETLPRDAFGRDGHQYECVDILRRVLMGEERKQVSEERSIENPKGDMETVLSLLPTEMPVETSDGFTGTLHLDISSIQTEAAGYGSTTTPYTVTRSYPNLSDADTQFIPKSIEEDGRALTFSSVQWSPMQTSNPGDPEIGERFTATVTYAGTKTTSYVTGYNVTASYRGEVSRAAVSAIRYTVVFAGTPIEAPIEQGDDNRWLEAGLISAIVIAVLLLLWVLFKKIKYWRTRHALEAIRDDLDLDDDDDDFGIGS